MNNFLTKWFNKKLKNEEKYQAKCGHLTSQKATLNAFGEKCEIKILSPKDEIEFCHDCLEKMTIRCAWCGKPIFIGDIVTLYTPNKDFKIPNYAITYSKDPLQLVGCGRTNCAETGADYCGNWLPPGKVKRFPSVIEMAMATGRPVIGNHNNGNTNLKVL